MAFRELTHTDDVDELLACGQQAWLFKHSTICPISAQALKQVLTYLESRSEQPAGMVVVQTHRPVSHYVAEQTGIDHQSPQILLVESGRVHWHASHFNITADAMAAAMTQSSPSNA